MNAISGWPIGSIARWALVLLGLLTAPVPASWADNEKITIHLTTLEWPPYTSSELPGGGLTTSLVRDALAEAGYDLEVTFLPWRRTMAEAESNPEIHGYFPEYYARDIEEKFIFSQPIGDSPVGFVHRREESLEWNTLDDLTDVRFGVVDGYVNSKAFDQAWADNRLTVDAASNDLINLRKLDAGRIDAAVLDPLVMAYLISTRRPLLRRSLRFHPQLLTRHQLYICFRHGALPEQTLREVNQALARLDHQREMHTYIQSISDQIAHGYLPQDQHMPLVPAESTD